MLRRNAVTSLAVAIATMLQVSHATENLATVPSSPPASTSVGKTSTIRETGTFLTLPIASVREQNPQTLRVQADGITVTLNEEDRYKQAVVYTGKIPSLTRASSDKDDIIVVVRPGNRFLALYPDRNQVVIGNAEGDQARLTFRKGSFTDKDYLSPAVKEVAREQLTREGVAYQVDRDDQGNIVIDLLAGFSQAAAKAIVDHEAFALAQVTTINQALKNSQVEKVRIRLVGTQVIAQDYAITAQTVSNISTLFQEGMKEYSPDLVAGFFEGNKNDTAIGWGYVNGRYTVNALYASTALRHEVGHNVGGGHCSPGNNDAYGWNNGKNATIQCGNDLGYYSNPDLQDNYGLAIGKTHVANMARVWSTNAEKMSAYSPAIVPFEREDAHLLKRQSVSLTRANGLIQYIELNVPKETRRLVVSAVPGPKHEESAKFKLYLSQGSWPSQNDHDYASREHWNTSLGVAKPSAGKWYLAVASRSEPINDILVDVRAFTSGDDDIPDKEWPDELLNPNAETGDLSGWSLRQGQFRVVSTQDGITPFNGRFFFTARQNDAEANHAPKDIIAQTITVNRTKITKDNITATLNFMSNGWGDGDYGVVALIAKDTHGNVLKIAETRTKGEQKKWLKNQVSLKMPSSAELLEVQVQAIKKAGAMSDVHFDDFQLTMNEGDKPVPPQPDPEPPVPDVDAWNQSKTYSTKCQKVTWEGSTWLNGWWTHGDKPGADGEWGVWRKQGVTNMHNGCK